MRWIFLCAALSACGGDPDDTPGGEHLRVQGEVQLDLTWTAESPGCPYVYDRRLFFLQVDRAGEEAQVSADSPIDVQSASILEEVNHASGDLVMTDEWGVGETSDQLENTIALVEMQLDFFATGHVTGIVDGTVDWQGEPCTSRYQVEGSFEPGFE